MKKTAEEIIKENIPNGIVNMKAVGNGKPQYQAEIAIISKCMHQFALQESEIVVQKYNLNKPGIRIVLENQIWLMKAIIKNIKDDLLIKQLEIQIECTKKVIEIYNK